MNAYCRECNREIIYEDHFEINGYAICIECRVETLKEESKKAVKALEFYADEKSFKQTCIDADSMGMHSLIDADKGKLARETLDEIKNRSIDLRGKKDKDQEGEVAKVR